MIQNYALVNKDDCVACGCCVKVCPKQAITVHKGIYATVNKQLCIACGQCAKECPASIIEMGVIENAE